MPSAASPRTSAMAALAAACNELAVGFRRFPIRSPTSNGRPGESLSLRAWTLLCYLSFETAIAETIAPRLPDLDRRRPAAADDRRPGHGGVPDLPRRLVARRRLAAGPKLSRAVTRRNAEPNVGMEEADGRREVTGGHSVRLRSWAT